MGFADLLSWFFGGRRPAGAGGRYARVERQVRLVAGEPPWTEARTREALGRAGFDPKAVEAYLASEAARRLLR